MVESCLIGYTGFIGANLRRAHQFTEHYNSANIESIRGKAFDTVVCAGISAVKWWANAHPEEDRDRIALLTRCLSEVEAASFILISTVDVYPQPAGVTESYDCAGVPNHAYGRHRLEFEQFVQGRFDNNTVLRLPGMFGPGLKKNVIFDLLHNNNVSALDGDSIFQYYYTQWLWEDIQTARAHGLKLVNFATEPLRTEEIARTFFPDAQLTAKSGNSITYDMRTIHADPFGATGPYLYSAAEVMTGLREFVRTYQKEAAA